MKLFHYEIHLISGYDDSYNKIQGVVMAKNIMGAMNKLNEYYVDDDDGDTLVVANLIEEDNTPYELSCEEA